MLKLLVFIVCTIMAIYVGGWLMFVRGIFNVIQFINGDMVEMTLLGFGIMKIIFASFVGWFIFAIGALPLLDNWRK